MVCKLWRRDANAPGHTRVAPPGLLRGKSFRRRREGGTDNFVRLLHDGVAALAMRGHTVTVQIILRQMHCENQDRDQTKI
jgi:hypothetical protein